ncbi:hypothetical protein [Donghicola eburneus]|uniref:hypothetical protein n=1 Tax=Donghicola eburneus TaxID=393278 RepID=UPI0008E37697|nr:hypothetical protein [Donghicola eburneus]SFQ66350.1 hypothetical protein SAMN05421764_10915 [Donghicola eburneus]
MNPAKASEKPERFETIFYQEVGEYSVDVDMLDADIRGKNLLVAGYNYTGGARAQIIDLEVGKTKNIEGFRSGALSAVFFNDDTFFIGGQEGGVIRKYNLASSEPLGAIHLGQDVNELLLFEGGLVAGTSAEKLTLINKNLEVTADLLEEDQRYMSPYSVIPPEYVSLRFPPVGVTRHPNVGGRETLIFMMYQIDKQTGSTSEFTSLTLEDEQEIEHAPHPQNSLILALTQAQYAPKSPILPFHRYGAYSYDQEAGELSRVAIYRVPLNAAGVTYSPKLNLGFYYQFDGEEFCLNEYRRSDPQQELSGCLSLSNDIKSQIIWGNFVISEDMEHVVFSGRNSEGAHRVRVFRIVL